MELIKAISLSLGSLQEPVLTSYRLGIIIHRLYLSKTFNGEPLSRLLKDHASAAEFNTAVGNLIRNGVLESHPNFPNKVYRILGRKESDAGEVACTVDPFCCVSHLSAMRFHGLTNRLPAKLFISGPNQHLWRQKSLEQMGKDLGDTLSVYFDGDMPKLTFPKMRRIDRTDIHRFSTTHPGAYKNVSEPLLRVSTIGRTFLDMLRSPHLCGGMAHVIEVWEEHARAYLKPIVSEIDRHGDPIDKVRAGYLINEKLRLADETVDAWKKFVSRGGSRKLDPSEPYMPQWSEHWCLSINI
jgi:hypothetical protein